MATFMPGLLRPFLRKKKVAKALAEKHGVWSLCFDLELLLRKIEPAGAQETNCRMLRRSLFLRARGRTRLLKFLHSHHSTGTKHPVF